jgi:hypothetical protein
LKIEVWSTMRLKLIGGGLYDGKDRICMDTLCAELLPAQC